MRVRSRAGTTALVLAAVLVAAGWLVARDRAARPAPADPTGRWRRRQPGATVVFTGRNHGKLKPCGCTAPQTGGLERLATLLDILRARSKGALTALALGGMSPDPIPTDP